MNRIIMVVALAAGLCSGCWSGRGSGYTVDSESAPMLVAHTTTMAKMREAIIRGGQNRDWAVKSEKAGCVTLLLSVRAGKHTVTVDVPYDEKSFSVKYVDSTNMEYEPATGTIRKKYVQWVRNLKQDIFREASRVK